VTTSSHTNLETRILGVVPILPDGSAYFEAPADTPLFLDPIDAGGNRVLMEWKYENTAVATGTHYPALQMGDMSGRPGATRAGRADGGGAERAGAGAEVRAGAGDARIDGPAVPAQRPGGVPAAGAAGRGREIPHLAGQQGPRPAQPGV